MAALTGAQPAGRSLQGGRRANLLVPQGGVGTSGLTMDARPTPLLAPSSYRSYRERLGDDGTHSSSQWLDGVGLPRCAGDRGIAASGALYNQGCIRRVATRAIQQVPVGL